MFYFEVLLTHTEPTLHWTKLLSFVYILLLGCCNRALFYLSINHPSIYPSVHPSFYLDSKLGCRHRINSTGWEADAQQVTATPAIRDVHAEHCHWTLLRESADRCHPWPSLSQVKSSWHKKRMQSSARAHKRLKARGTGGGQRPGTRCFHMVDALHTPMTDELPVIPLICLSTGVREV